MKTEIDRDFKKQFKLSLIKSLKLGFNVDEIKQNLKKQSYPSELVDELVKEFESDEDILSLIRKPEKPNIFRIIKNKLFKMSEESKIRKITDIHSAYFNLIIEEKRKFNEESLLLDEAIHNPENKIVIIDFIKNQKTWIDKLIKRSKKIVGIAKSLVNIEITKDIKEELNNILEFVQTEETSFCNELINLKNIQRSINQVEEVKQLLEKERKNMKQKESMVEKIISQISKKSAKFREIISQM